MDPSIRPFDDGELVRRHLEGERTAVDVLYRRYSPRLVRYLRRKIGDPEAAQDLAQETFARALTALPRFDTVRPMWPWLKTIATNLAIDRARHNHGIAEVPLREEDAPAIDPVRGLEERSVLEPALARLTAQHRTALRLRYVEGWRMEDVARFLGLSATAFSQLLYRARRRLRQEYRRLSDGVPGLVLAPARIVRRWIQAGAERVGRATGRTPSDLAQAGGTLHQFAAAGLGVLLILGAGGAVPSDRGQSPPALAAIEDRDPLPAPQPRELRTKARHRADIIHSRPGHTTPQKVAGTMAHKVIDPSGDATQPEDTHLTSIAASEDGRRLFAVGYVPCPRLVCDSILFSSSDGGSTWSRLPARGLMARVVLLPPGYGTYDRRVFAVGTRGLLVSSDDGASFRPAAPNSTPGSGPVAISPAFSGSDPVIVMGGSVLTRYRDDLEAVEPFPAVLGSDSFDPAYARAGAPILFVGSMQVDPLTGTTRAVISRCDADHCTSSLLGDEMTPPHVRPDPHDAETVWAFTGTGLFLSTDGGTTFGLVSRPPTDQWITDVPLTGNGTVLVGTQTTTPGQTGGVYAVTANRWTRLTDRRRALE